MENKIFRRKQGTLKKCFVPRCESTTVNSPNKLFIRLPVGAEKRKKWAEAAGRTGKNVFFNHDSSVYCCEDHFNLPEDAENLMYYNIMGGNARLKLKPGVLPHIFQCQSEDSPSQRGMRILEKALQKDRQENVAQETQEQPPLLRIEEILQATSSATSFFDEYMDHVAERASSSVALSSHKDIQCNLMAKKPHVRSKSTSIDVKFLCCSTTMSNARKITVDAGTSPIRDPDFLNLNMNFGTLESLAIKEEPVERESHSEECLSHEELRDFDKYEFIKVEPFCPNPSSSGSPKSFIGGSRKSEHLKEPTTLEPILKEKITPIKLELTSSADFGVWNKEPSDCSNSVNQLKSLPPTIDQQRIQKQSINGPCNEKISLKKSPLSFLESDHPDSVQNVFTKGSALNGQIRSYECSVCGKTLKRKMLLRSHMKEHFGKVRFKCEICEKAFVLEKSWKKHLLSHSGEKTFECSVFEKSFKRESVMERHMLNHTGKRKHDFDV